MKRLMSAFVLIALVIATAKADEKDAAKKDQERLQGTWRMLNPAGSGQTIPDSKRECKGDETTVTFGGVLFMKSKFSLDPTKQPKAIDYEVLEGNNKGKKMLGIYAIDGDVVKFCFAPPGKERPAEFTSALDGRVMSAWKREKTE